MFCSADLNNNYLFIPEFTEIDPFIRTFKDKLTLCSQGWTYASYDTVPKIQIKGATYFDEIAPTTRSFDTEQEFLTALKLGLNGATGEFQNAELGLIMNKSVFVQGSNLGFQSNRIPTLFTLVPTASKPLSIITGFAGNFSFETGLFHGQIQFREYTELWNV